MIENAIKSAFRKKKERNWDIMYWAIDIHDTIIKGKYSSDQEYNPSDECLQVLKLLSDRKDMKLILWTSSYISDITRFKNWLSNTHYIEFDYINSNPDCKDINYATFKKKFYFLALNL